MKKLYICLIVMSLATMTSVSVYPQRITDSENKITASDLESYVSFLASFSSWGKSKWTVKNSLPKPLPE